jgi:hypothetical protein
VELYVVRVRCSEKGERRAFSHPLVIALSGTGSAENFSFAHYFAAEVDPFAALLAHNSFAFVSSPPPAARAEWIKIALADLPVLTQMALNIASLVAALQMGKQVNPSEAAAIQNVSAEASKDLNLLLALYEQYKAKPDKGTLAKIQSVIGDINQNLPALLQAAHISDPALSAKVTAAVNLILSTVTSFASLIPQPPAPSIAASRTATNATVPHARDLKKQWNAEVCAATGNAAFDTALAVCKMK